MEQQTAHGHKIMYPPTLNTSNNAAGMGGQQEQSKKQALSLRSFLCLCVTGGTVLLLSYSSNYGSFLQKFSLMPIQRSYLERRFPKAIIIGAGKSGTTALWSFLSFHPKIVRNEKRLRFFHLPDRYKQGLEKYRLSMPLSSPDQITISKDSSYFSGKDVPSRMSHFNSSLLLLLIVKDPINRFISNFYYLRDRKQLKTNKNISIEEMIQNPLYKIDLKKCLEWSYYGKHLANWLKFYPRNQMHIVDGEMFIKNNPSFQLSEIETFLGIGSYLKPYLFKYIKTKGYYCLTENELPMCLQPLFGRIHPPLSTESIGVLKKILKKDIKLFRKLSQVNFTWMNDYP